MGGGGWHAESKTARLAYPGEIQDERMDWAPWLPEGMADAAEADAVSAAVVLVLEI